MALTPGQRSMRGRLGAYAALSRHDSREINARARQVFRDSFRAGHGCRLCPRVDMPDGLPDGEVTRRAEMIRRAHFSRLAWASSRARSRRNETAPVVETPGAVPAEVRRASDERPTA